jgi:hypothetical protein
MNFFELNGVGFGNGSVIAVKDVDIRNIIHSMKKEVYRERQELVVVIFDCKLPASEPRK